MKNKYSFTYESQGPNTYLVYEVGKTDEIDSMSLGMLTNNKIREFVPVVFTQMDTKRYLKYNISAQVPIRQIFSEKIKKKQMLSIFSGIVDAMISAEEYMIDSDLLLLDMDYIFSDLSTYETKVICLPISREKISQKDPKMFFKDILFNVQFDSAENGNYVARIMNYLNGDAPFSFEAFRSVLDEIKGEAMKVKAQTPKRYEEKLEEPVPEVKKNNSEPVAIPNQVVKHMQGIPIPSLKEKKQSAEKTEEKQISLFYLLQHYNKENAALYKAQREAKKKLKEDNPNKEKKGKSKEKNHTFEDMGFAVPGQERIMSDPRSSKTEFRDKTEFDMQYVDLVNELTDMPEGEEMDFGETVLLEEEVTEGTVYLGDEEEEQIQKNVPYLIRKANQEKVNINKEIFKIGKDKEYADYYINNRAISHKHAYIIKRNEDYFVVDTNSKNHTFVDGNRIQSNMEVKLVDGTIICFAKEEYEFHFY